MKKFLLGTTTIAGFALASWQAQAADPLKVTITGWVSGVAVFGDQSHLGYKPRNETFKWDGEIHFNGETKLDNGMKVGFVVELEAFSTTPARAGSGDLLNSDQIDEHYIWFEDTWGRIEYGATNGAGSKLHAYIPSVMPSHGVDTPDYFHFATPSWSSAGLGSSSPFEFGTNEDFNKVTYFTPSISGFTFGVSYTPNIAPGTTGNACGSGGGSANQYGVCPKGVPGTFHDGVEAGLQYKNEFNGIGILASIGGFYASVSDKGSPGIVTGLPTTDWKRWATGINLTYQGFTVGGAFRWDNQGTAGKNNEIMYGLGVTYDTGGPWKFGVAWSHTRDQDDGNKADTLDFVDGGAVYTVGPGIDLFAGLQYAYFGGNLGGPNSHGVAGYLGSKLTF